MRPLLRTFMVMTLLVMPAAAGAQTLAARDLVALAQAGLGDDVLIALIDSHNAVFNLGYVEVLELRKQGLSERVLIKMIESTAPRAVSAPRAASAPDRTESDSRPVIVKQTVKQEVRVEVPQPHYVQVPVYVAVPVRSRAPVREREPEPVYWGFGGQRRPDAWQEPAKKAPPARPSGR